MAQRPDEAELLNYPAAVVRISGVLLFVAVTTMLVSCGEDEPRPSPGSEPTPTRSVESPDFSLTEMLGEVPALVREPGERFTLYAGDLTHATDLAGLERPTSPEAAGMWVSNLGGIGVVDGWPPVVFVPLDVPLAGSSPANLVDEDLGWSVVDVDRFVAYRIAGNAHTLVAQGSFDDHTLDGVRQMSGRIHSAGQAADLDGELEQATPARPLGVPLRMAVDDARLMASNYTSAVQAWLAGTDKTLVDDALLAPIAALLDERDVYSALIVTSSEVGSVGLPTYVLEALEITADDFPTFDTYAIGWSFERDRPTVTVVYHAPDGASTKDLRRKVAARWHGATFRGDDVENYVEVGRISIEGRNVVVSMTPADRRDPGIVFHMHERQDLPFLSR